MWHSVHFSIQKGVSSNQNVMSSIVCRPSLTVFIYFVIIYIYLFSEIKNFHEMLLRLVNYQINSDQCLLVHDCKTWLHNILDVRLVKVGPTEIEFSAKTWKIEFYHIIEEKPAGVRRIKTSRDVKGGLPTQLPLWTC